MAYSEKISKQLIKSLNTPNPLYHALVIEPKRKPWSIRTDFDKHNKPRLGARWLRFKRKKDAVAFWEKVQKLYDKEKNK